MAQTQPGAAPRPSAGIWKTSASPSRMPPTWQAAQAVITHQSAFIQFSRPSPMRIAGPGTRSKASSTVCPDDTT